MATRVLTRSLLSSLTRSYSSPSPFSLRRLRSLVSVAANVSPATTAAGSLRGFATRPTSSSLNDPNPNWSNRPPKETILLDGCDFEHWLVVMEKPEGDPVRDEIIDSYIKTLASVVGSEEEARMKIYSVSTRHYYAFGALVSEELSYKLKELPRVRWVLPDSYLDVKNKDYGGEPFINGQAVPYDPKYHEEWVRNNARANERNRRNDRPRNNDRSRNFERRRDMGNQNAYNAGPNMTGVPSNTSGMQHPNMGGPPNMAVSPNPVAMQHSNMGGPPNQGVMQHSNMGVMQQQPNMPPNMRGMQQPNAGRMQPNMGGVLPNTAGGPPHSYGGAPNSAPNFQNNGGPNRGGMPYQSGPGPNQNYAPNMPGANPYQNQGFNQNYAPNTSGGDPNQNQGPNQNYPPNTSGGNPYQNQNMPPPNYE